MSSISCCMRGDLMSPRSIAFARARSTGWPIRATLRIDIRHRLYKGEMDYRFCPRCGGSLEKRSLRPVDPERLVCTACDFVFYLDPKVAVGTIIRTADSQLVLVRRAVEPGHGVLVVSGGHVRRWEEVG